ncbi:hypothetical protein SAMN04488134_103117 [Amphibacillus marinus]|uniref:Butirosin biosynthesis protein H, N-terminal n=1 Tax=Amphibacillus marinus TaxID=872970 RepID=A0A1H8L845_9BACI|nr:hypothetical protein [Amphibacillus marinus]SEO01283.1 hypothetical protein SAMN04488134_103117 [Amphibacillus marinus]
MNIKQSNNILPNLHPIAREEHGENYWFNGCAGYLMECLGEKDFDYWFFAGLTGDNFTQIYSKDYFRGNSALDYLISEKNKHEIVELIFSNCGYASTFVPLKQILSNREMYVQMVMSYIDKGVPVILNDYGKNPHGRFSWGVLVGYADFGKTLLYTGADASEPDSISLEDLLPKNYAEEDEYCHGWVFVGEKLEEKELAKIYRNRILSLPDLFAIENEKFVLGANAFRTWADKIDSGFFEQVQAVNFDNWALHTVYVCCLATNSGGCKGFLEQALELNPDMDFIGEIIDIYTETGQYWNNDYGTDLEAIGGGFNITLEALQNKENRPKIVSKLHDFAICMDEVVSLINKFKTANQRRNYDI